MRPGATKARALRRLLVQMQFRCLPLRWGLAEKARLRSATKVLAARYSSEVLQRTFPDGSLYTRTRTGVSGARSGQHVLGPIGHPISFLFCGKPFPVKHIMALSTAMTATGCFHSEAILT